MQKRMSFVLNKILVICFLVIIIMTFFVPPLEDDKKLSPMPPPEANKKNCLNTNHANNRRRNKRKRIKNLNSKQTLTRLPKILAIKAWNNSSKLRNEIRQVMYLLYQHDKITKKLYNLMKPIQ